MRQLDVIILPQSADEMYFENQLVVVVDVLRASTTIVTALANGAKEVIAKARPDEVRQAANGFQRESCLLCGEREGKALPGFDLGNSPAEYSPERVKNKTLLYTSTNGSQMMVKARRAAQVWIGSFVNITAVLNGILMRDENVCIACSGREGQFSLEDTVCAGMMVDLLNQQDANRFEATDSAYASQILYQHDAGNLLEMLQRSKHGRYLISLGMENDLLLAAETNRHGVLPYLKNEKFIIQ